MASGNQASEKRNIKFALVSNKRPESLKVAKSVLDFLAPRATIEIEKDTAAALGAKGKKLEEITADVVVCVGGDGTILKCLRSNPAPVFGINTSIVGFLAESSPVKMKRDLKKIIDWKFRIEERVKITAALKGRKFPGAVNEIAVKSDIESKVIGTRIRLDGGTIEDVRGDGILVSTPSGSTAYAMSAGGPIVDPRVNAFLIVPIAPFRFGSRPIIVPANSEIEIEITSRSGHILVDGFCEMEVCEGDVLVCRKSKETGKFVRLCGGGASSEGIVASSGYRGSRDSGMNSVSRFYGRIGEKLR